MEQASGTDVFISFDAADGETVRAFAVALQARGVSASFDPLRDERDESLRRIHFALGHCKVFLAWRSAHYDEQRALQWEFAAVFAAAARRREERQRLIVMQVAADAELLPPSVGARVGVEAVPATTQESLNEVAARMALRVAQVHGCICGSDMPLPRSLPYEVFGFERFADRTPELWRIHEFFTDPQRRADSGLRAVQLIGPAGAGKSVLAQEYAERFATAYPGGIFWLDAGCMRIDSASELQSAREHTWCEFAARLGLPPDRDFAVTAAALHRHLAERALPFLWIVDRAPADHSIDAIRSWLAPHPLGDSILMARSGEYAPLGPQIHIENLHAGTPEDLRQTIVRLTPLGRQCLRISAVLADAPIPVALMLTALSQPSHGSTAESLTDAELAVEELTDAGLATRVNGEYFCLVPCVREAVHANETAGELDAPRAVAALTLASELMQAPDAAYTNPYVRWIPHALHIAATAAISNQLVEVAAWLSRFESLGALRTGNRRALSRLREGDVAKAQELFDMELTAARRGLGEDHLATLTSENNLGAVLGLQGNFAVARSMFEHALEVRGKALGEEHPDTLTPLNNLAAMLWSEADVDGAHALFECVVEQRRRWLGETHPETLVAMKNLAVTLRQRGDYAGARTLLEHVVATRRAALGEQHPDTRAAMGSLARTLSEECDALLRRAGEMSDGMPDEAGSATDAIPGETADMPHPLLLSGDELHTTVRLSS